MKLWSKETAGLGVIGASLYGANQISPEIIGNTVSTIAGATSGILETTGNAIENITEPVIGAMAPTAAPMVAPTLAGAYLGNKVGSYLFNEDAVWRKRAATVTGGMIGAATSSVASPYIVWAAALYAGRKIPLWTAKKIGQTASAGVHGVGWFVWGWAKWMVKWAYNSTKSGWNKFSQTPQIGF